VAIAAERVNPESATGPAGRPPVVRYRELAAQGVRAVVGLRAEELSAKELALPRQAGLTSVRLLIRDGQTPTEQQADDFFRIVGRSAGGSTCTAAPAPAVPG
jgi:hypothetical protein